MEIRLNVLMLSLYINESKKIQKSVFAVTTLNIFAN